MLVVTPCTSGRLERNNDAWQGNVIAGDTVLAASVTMPTAIRASRWGVSACSIPSGRMPSMMIRAARVARVLCKSVPGSALRLSNRCPH